MCPPAVLAAAGFAATWALNYSTRANKENKKANQQLQANLDKLEQEKQAKIEENKLASSVQSTTELPNPTLQDKLENQKIPLNGLGDSGLAVGNSLSTGLNLGGY